MLCCFIAASVNRPFTRPRQAGPPSPPILSLHSLSWVAHFTSAWARRGNGLPPASANAPCIYAGWFPLAQQRISLHYGYWASDCATSAARQPADCYRRETDETDQQQLYRWPAH